MRCGRRITFFDDESIDKVYNLCRRFHRPRKLTQPVLRPSESWESLLCAYGSVLYDESLYKLYYTLWWLDKRSPYACTLEALAYAYSEDGRTWTKPKLNIVGQVNGGANNLIHFGRFADQPCVLRLENPKGRHKYAMVYYGDFPPLGCGVRICYSEDSIHWEWPGELVWQTAIDCAQADLDFYAADDTVTWYFDPAAKKYVIIRKVMNDVGLDHKQGAPICHLPDTFKLRRAIARCESSDLQHWENHQIILAPDCDARGVDYHRLSVMPYHDLFLGLLENYDRRPGRDMIQLELVYSRDGIKWNRLGSCRSPYIERQSEGDWDDGVMFAPSGFMHRGRTTHIYYGAMQCRMNSESLANCQQCGIGLAELENDTFCSLQSKSYQPGMLICRPTLITNQLQCHANVQDQGLLQIALLDDEYRSIAGYDWHDCQLQSVPGADMLVTWNRKGVPRPDHYRVGIRAINADLFSITSS